MTHPLRVGLMFRQQGFAIDVQRHVWREADDAGFDHIWGFDHLFAIGDPMEPVFDGWTLLGAMAETTRSAGIGLMVSGNLYRHPGMLAKIAATVDHLSDGRLEVGLGAAWQEAEFAMMGLPFPPPRERIERLDEACSVLKRLWTEDRVTFEGRYYRLTDAVSEPKPLRKPHPPLWIGGTGRRRMLRVVATHADVWNSAASDFEANVESSRVLDEHCGAIGRDPASLRRSVQIRWAQGADATCRAAERYRRAGFSDIVLMVDATGSGALPIAEALMRDVLPRVRELG